MLKVLNKIPFFQISIPSRLTPSNASYATESLATVALGKAKKKTGKVGPGTEKIKLPVETDTHKLVNYLCGSNLLKEGGEDVKLGPDSDYPEWLFNLYVGPAKKLSELNPETLDYWRLVRKLNRKKKHRMASLAKFHK